MTEPPVPSAAPDAATRRPRVFLSYARKDQARIGSIVRALEAEGIDVWWDTAIEVGTAFSARIAGELDAADAVVVAWSKHAVASPWVLDEAEVGRNRNILVPVTLDGTPPPLGFRQLQTVDLSKWRSRNHPQEPLPARVVDAIWQLAGSGPPPASAAEASAETGRSWRSFALFGALVALLLVAAAAWKFWPQGKADSEPTVAVLPFDNLSNRTGAPLFAAGLSEEIIDTIARDKRLRVLGRASAKSIHDAWIADPAMARTKFGVDWVLEGSIRGGEDKDPLRVSVRLIDTADGSERWTQVFDWQGSNPTAIQEEIARQVATRISGPVAGDDAILATPQPAVDEAIYSRVVVARELTRTRQTDALVRARALASESIAEAPSYAAAYAARSSAASLLSVLSGQDTGALRKEARADAEKATTLDPTLAAGFDALGLSLWLNSEREPAVRAARRAVALQPANAEARVHLAAFCGVMAQFDCAISNFETASAKDPLFAPPVVSLLAFAEYLNRPGVGVKAADRLVSLATDTATVDWVAAKRAATAGRLAEALRRADTAVQQNSKLTVARLIQMSANSELFVTPAPAGTPRRFAALGEASARQMLAQAGQLDPWLWDKQESTNVAWALVGLGRSDELVRFYDSRFADTAAYAAAAPPSEQASAPLAFALDRAGRAADAAAVRRVAELHLETLDTAGVAPAQTALSRAALMLGKGDRAGAVSRLQQGLVSQWWAICRGPVWLGSNPMFAGLSSDPGFAGVVRDCAARLNAERKAVGLPPG